MVTTRVFYNNRTQAVRLSKDVALPDDVVEVDIVAHGRSRTITPAGGSWLDFWDDATPVTEDFLAERDQPEAQERAL